MSPLFAVFIIGAIISFMLFYKRKKAPFTLPEGYKKMLEDHVVFYRSLDAGSKINFENKIQEFLGYIDVTGVKTEVSELDRILVAASGVIPIFGFPKWHYYNLKEVLLYDDRFNADNFSTSGEGREVLGMVGNGAMQMQMILSKPELYKGFGVSPGQENTGIHEFVHLLDKEDGDVDGLPEALLAKSYTVPWLRLVAENINIRNYMKCSPGFLISDRYPKHSSCPLKFISVFFRCSYPVFFLPKIADILFHSMELIIRA